MYFADRPEKILFTGSHFLLTKTRSLALAPSNLTVPTTSTIAIVNMMAGLVIEPQLRKPCWHGHLPGKVPRSF